MQIHKISQHETELWLESGEIVLLYKNIPVAAMRKDKFVRSEARHSDESESCVSQWLDGLEATTVRQSAVEQILTRSR